jgi:hypothetical protein
MGADGLVAKWTDRARKLREWAAAKAAARVWEAAARELEVALLDADDELLNLQEASATSGYSAEHLGRLVRQGRIPNAGRPNAPRIRARDLPRKPGVDRRPLFHEGLPTGKTAVVRQIVEGLRVGAGGRAA